MALNIAALQMVSTPDMYHKLDAAAAHHDMLHLFAFDNVRENHHKGRTLAVAGEPMAVGLALMRRQLPALQHRRMH